MVLMAMKNGDNMLTNIKFINDFINELVAGEFPFKPLSILLNYLTIQNLLNIIRLIDASKLKQVRDISQHLNQLRCVVSNLFIRVSYLFYWIANEPPEDLATEISASHFHEKPLKACFMGRNFSFVATNFTACH